MGNFYYENEGQLFATSGLLNSLTKEFGSSFYLFNKDLFIRNLRNFRSSFQKSYSNVSLGYSYKTNYLPAACKIAKKEGVLAEVVSGLEYRLALALGYQGSQIIFNGPLKQKDELFQAFHNNSIVHFDSYEEIKILKSYLKTHSDQTVRCALRCNFDIGEDQISRFGFDAEGGEAQNVYEELFSIKGCNPLGIHCHFSTNHRSLESYKRRTSKLIALSKEIFEGHQLSYIDIGGGFFGEMPDGIKELFSFDVPSYEEYGQIIGEMMLNNFPNENVSLILEPGASVIANTMCLVCQVASIKKVQGRDIVTLSGGIHNVRPTGTSGNIPFRTVKATEEKRLLKNALIGGYTCMETDIIAEEFNGDLNIGDYLIFDNMGAYNIVFKPPFIKEAPPILQVEKKNSENVFSLVREMESLQQIFSSYIF